MSWNMEPLEDKSEILITEPLLQSQSHGFLNGVSRHPCEVARQNAGGVLMENLAMMKGS